MGDGELAHPLVHSLVYSFIRPFIRPTALCTESAADGSGMAQISVLCRGRLVGLVEEAGPGLVLGPSPHCPLSVCSLPLRAVGSPPVKQVCCACFSGCWGVEMTDGRKGVISDHPLPKGGPFSAHTFHDLGRIVPKRLM